MHDSRIRPFRLIVLLAQLRPTGLVRQLIESLSELSANHGVEPVVVCVGRAGQDPEALEQALKRANLAYEILWETGPFDRAPLRQLQDRVTTLRPQAIQTHGYKPAAYALKLCHGGQVPWLAFYHGRTTTDWKVRLYHYFERWAMGRADMIVAVADGVEHHFRRADRGRIRVVPNAVLPASHGADDRSSAREALGLEQTGTLLGFVGRLSREKGPDLFVEALAALRADSNDLQGLVVGDGPMRNEVEGLARSLGIEDSVHFLGQTDRVGDAYRAVDALVISSRSEVFPNVLLEAVDAGVAVAATPVGGISAVATNIGSVSVARDITVSAIVQCIEQALSFDEAERASARDRMHEAYSQDRRVEALLGVYRDLGMAAGE